MKYIIWIAALLIGSAGVVEGQTRELRTLPDGSKGIKYFCDQPAAQEELLENNPELRKSAEKAREQLESRAATFDAEDFEKGGDGDDYFVPVVFHIIHNNGSENISFEQIQDAMEILNEDFNAENPDFDQVIGEFENIAADVGVQFRLARYDPDGNCTNGVIRTESTETYDGGENLKNISPTWDRASYLNIWVCEDIGSGAAGYTFRPWAVNGPGGEEDDGIVILHDYVGSIGTGSYSRSRALTHEVGHWINLPHTWGQTNQPGEPENCNDEDNITDTPNTIGHTSCNIDAETCGSLDNVQNYMDYSYCYKMFTNGQKSRMIDALTSGVADRNQLWTEENLEETGILEEPVLCQADFSVNTRMICAGDTITFDDQSYSNVTSWNWSFEGGDPSSSSEQNPEIVFDQPGVYQVTLEAGDGVSTVSETKEEFITVLPEVGEPLPFSEGFEEISSLPSDFWFLDNDNNDITWEIMQNIGSTGSQSIGIENFNKPADETERIMSNVISIPEGSEVVYISYKVAYSQIQDGDNDRLRLFVSPDCGELWSLRDQSTGSSMAAGDPQFGYFVPESDDEWITEVIDNTPDFYLTDQFRIMFEFSSDGGNNIYIDDINIALEDVSGEREIVNVDLELFPNPASSQATLDFALDRSGFADIAIYDLSGRRVRTISKGELGAGVHRLQIDTDDLSKGMYLIRMEGELLKGSRKLIVN